MSDMKWKRESRPFNGYEYRCGDFLIYHSEKRKTSGGITHSACWTLSSFKLRVYKTFSTLKEAKEAAQKILDESN